METKMSKIISLRKCREIAFKNICAFRAMIMHHLIINFCLARSHLYYFTRPEGRGY
jgi:hypothetical protein